VTLHSEAHLQTGRAGSVGRHAGVAARVFRLGEGYLQGARAQHLRGLIQQAAIFVPRDKRGGVAVGVAIQRHGMDKSSGGR